MRNRSIATRAVMALAGCLFLLAPMAGTGTVRAAGVDFHVNCDLPHGSMSRNGNAYTFTLRNGDVGGCGTDDQARHSAPFWERAEVRSDDLEKNVTYEIVFEVMFDPDTVSSERTSFFQIHTYNSGCDSCYPALMLKTHANGRLGASVLNTEGYHDELPLRIARADVAGRWTPVRIVVTTYPGETNLLRIWLDGTQVLDTDDMFIAAAGRPHLKMGLYRPGSEDGLPVDRVSIRNVEAQKIEFLSCVQSNLTKLGYDPGPADGLMGPRTRSAAEAFAADEQVHLPALTAGTSIRWCEFLNRKVDELPRFNVVSSPSRVLSERDTERLWNAYETASQCFEHPTYGEGQRLDIRRLAADELANREWVNPFTPSQSDISPRVGTPRHLIDPIVTVTLDESYGERVLEVDRARDGFVAAIAGARAGREGAETELKQALLEWATADAFRAGIRVSWGHQPVDWQMMTAIMSFVTAAGVVGDILTEEEKAVIGPWLNRLVADVADSRWKDRQDNKAYMKVYMMMLWGLTIGDDQAVQTAIDTFKLAIHDMRPDGSMPIDTQRSGMGLKYNSDSVSYLVMIAALLHANTGLDLFAYEVNGRSLHNAVDFVVRSLRSPVETNRVYAIGCPDGGDRWGSADSPSMSFASSATYLLVYASLFPDSPHAEWIETRYGYARSTPMETFGGAPLQLFDFAAD